MKYWKVGIAWKIQAPHSFALQRPPLTSFREMEHASKLERSTMTETSDSALNLCCITSICAFRMLVPNKSPSNLGWRGLIRRSVWSRASMKHLLPHRWSTWSKTAICQLWHVIHSLETHRTKRPKLKLPCGKRTSVSSAMITVVRTEHDERWKGWSIWWNCIWIHCWKRTCAILYQIGWPSPCGTWANRTIMRMVWWNEWTMSMWRAPWPLWLAIIWPCSFPPW